MNTQKVLSALVAASVALTGVLTGTKWLTIVALGLWIIAMLVFGRGPRGPIGTDNS